MKFTISQKRLLDALQIVSGVVPARSTTPILETILFELGDNSLKITGTDLEVSISTTIDPDVTETPGSIALPAKVIIETIRALPDIPVHFDVTENQKATITTDKGFYQISGFLKDNFPQLESSTGGQELEVDNSILHRMFSKTIFAVSSEELRPSLMGVYLQVMPDEFRMVSTDGHRLSKVINSSISFAGQPMNMIIPPKAVQTALKNLTGPGNTSLFIDENSLSFQFNNTTLYTRLVEGEYPDYEKVIPRDNNKSMIVNRDMLMSSVRRVSLFSSALTHQISFAIDSGKLVVCSEDADVGGEAREELEVEYSDEPMEIGYNAQYILDIVKHIDTDNVLFSLKTNVNATLITPESQDENEDFCMLIMPIKLNK